MTTAPCDYADCVDTAPTLDILRGAGLAASLAVIFALPLALGLLAALRG